MIAWFTKVRFSLRFDRALALVSTLCFSISATAQVSASQVSSGATVIQSGPSSSATPSTPEKFTVTGTVVDTATGEPVPHALVQIYDLQRRNTFSDENGRFQVEGVAQGSYAVMAQKPGYFNDQQLSRSVVHPAEAGPDSPPAVVKLTPEAIISGKVTNTSGLPLEHVSLSLTYIDIREGRRHWESKGSATTDADGEYRFSSLRPGTYYLSAGPYTPLSESLFEPDERATRGYQEFYYPSATELASASAIQLRGGQQTEADFALNQVPVYAISGTISGYAPNQGVSLQIFDQSGVSVTESYQFSQENGRFDVHPLPAGSYVIRAFSSLGSNQQVQAEARFTLSADLHNLNLALAPVPSIAVIVQMDGQAGSESGRTGGGRLYTPTGSAVRGALPLAIRLLGTGPNVGELYASPDNPQAPHALLFRNVYPGRYTAIIEPKEGWYVSSADYGRTNLLTDDLVIASGAPPLSVNILLSNDSGSLTGTVNVPDKYNSQVTILALSASLPKASPNVAFWYPPPPNTPDASGFSLDGLAPGDYLVFAFDHLDGLEYASRDVLQNYASQAAHVTLTPGQRSKITLDLIRTEEAQ